MSFIVVDAEGTEVRRIVSGAGSRATRSTASPGTAATTTAGGPGRHLPDARRAPRREPRDRLGEGDHRRRRAAAGGGRVGQPSRRSRPACRASRRASRCATAARRTRPRSCACSAPTTARHTSSGASAGGPDRTRELGRARERGRGAHPPGARGRLHVHVRGARQGGQPHRGAAADADGGSGPARHGRVGAELHPARPAVGGPGGRARAPPGGAGGPRLRLRRVAARRPQAAPPRRSRGGALPDPRPERHAHRRLRGARARAPRQGRLAARRGGAAAAGARAAARARSSCCPRSRGRA